MKSLSTNLSTRAKFISGLAFFWLLLFGGLLLIYQNAYHKTLELNGKMTADLVNRSVVEGLFRSMSRGEHGKGFQDFLKDVFSNTPGFRGTMITDMTGRPVWTSSSLCRDELVGHGVNGLIAGASNTGYSALRASDGYWIVTRLLRNERSCGGCHSGTGAWLGAVITEGTMDPERRLEHQRQEIIVFLSLFLLLAAGLLSAYWLLDRSFARPLAALAESIQAIDMVNPAVSKLNHAAGKEISVVVNQFNLLLDRLSDYRKALLSSEEQFRQAQKMEAVGRLAGGVAHDFNNLITAINGYGRMLLQSLPPDDARRQDAEEILIAGDRAASLTRRLLAFSRKQVLKPVTLDLNAAVGSAVKMLQRLIGEDIRLEVSLGASPCCVVLDPGQVDQLLMNLAVNARDAMPGGGTLSIAVGLEDPPENWRAGKPALPAGPLVSLAVADTGTGMTPEVRSHLFEPFFTTKAQGKGTGLGLSTVYGTIKQSGGHIEVETAAGRGTKFLMYFHSAPPPKEEAGPKEEAAPSGGSETILLVEDEEALLKLGRRVLSELGYKVLAAVDATAALAALREHGRPVDLLVTDMRLHGMGGGELARLVSERCPGVKILYVSGHIDPEILEGLPAGDNYLQKPFSPDALAGKVRSVLDSGT
ncbi:MAG: ATP-binding protein [Elusimicrobia bacterium]|nr:ATP-binding protein [Elusimicrobiota bacterium]